MKKYLLWLLLCFTPQLYAHPHSFVEMKTQFIADEVAITGLQMTWTFDVITSADVLYDLLNGDDSAQNWHQHASDMMDNIIANDYFTRFYRYDSTTKSALISFSSPPINYSLSHQDLQAILTFSIAFESPQPLSQVDYKLFTFEPTFYVDMYYDNISDIELAPTMQPSCKLALQTPEPSEELQNYALSLDRDDAPEPNMDLGMSFAQQVNLVCR
ncbi:uncharacterized protein HI_1249-like [Teleopsis dalmanni]|uniref:uncharacterized protein HI_1249-like n=1 Tax=Teleopsis dalmanni TaxID=139649 RepID=UPI0018CE57C6|nr:uncharacterized protein HI_1249-like [Teleopsis dalmanni]